MFWNKNKDVEAKEELESIIKDLEKDKRRLKEDLAELKLKKKLEDEDIKHMVKINNERKDIELEKEKMKLERKSAVEIAAVKDSYQNKTEEQLEKQLTNMKDMNEFCLMWLLIFNESVIVNESDQGIK